MAGWFDTVTDLKRQAAVVRRRRYGLIEVTEGEFVRIHLRPLPKSISMAGIAFGRWWWHSLIESDSCWLYYNQPRRFPNFLALKYVVSTVGTRFATFRRAVALLDEVARIKRTDALLCDVSNVRISDRLMRRWGWEPHKPQRWHRNYIKRFYGAYPAQRAIHQPPHAAVVGLSGGEVPVHG